MTSINTRNTYHTLYDPKSIYRKKFEKPRYASDYKQKGLPQALERSLQFASKRRETHEGDNQESQVFFWARKDDILDVAKSPMFSQMIQATETKFENERQKFKIDADSIDIHPMEQQTDFKGHPINGLEGQTFTFKFQGLNEASKTGKLYTFESSALDILSQHSLEKGYITPEQHKICSDLIQKTNPDSKAYLYEVGLVNDIKKFLLLFLQSKAFKGGERYYDLDKADRQKLIPENQIIQTLNQASCDTSVGCFMGLDIDNVLMQDGLTDSDNAFSVLRHYHEFLEMIGDDFYYNKLHNPEVSVSDVQNAFSERIKEQREKCDTGRALEEMGYTPEEIQKAGHRGTLRSHPECDIEIHKCLILKKDHRGIDVDFLFKRIFQPMNMTSWIPNARTRPHVTQQEKEPFILKSMELKSDINGSWFADADRKDDQKTWK